VLTDEVPVAISPEESTEAAIAKLLILSRFDILITVFNGKCCCGQSLHQPARWNQCTLKTALKDYYSS
jgi:hypothetical protein